MDVDDPARGDVMVFVPPHDPRYFIKRVVGIPVTEFATRIKRFSLTASA